MTYLVECVTEPQMVSFRGLWGQHCSCGWGCGLLLLGDLFVSWVGVGVEDGVQMGSGTQL
jgi:hypothetical protein